MVTLSLQLRTQYSVMCMMDDVLCRDGAALVIFISTLTLEVKRAYLYTIEQVFLGERLGLFRISFGVGYSAVNYHRQVRLLYVHKFQHCSCTWHELIKVALGFGFCGQTLHKYFEVDMYMLTCCNGVQFNFRHFDRFKSIDYTHSIVPGRLEVLYRLSLQATSVAMMAYYLYRATSEHCSLTGLLSRFVIYSSDMKAGTS